MLALVRRSFPLLALVALSACSASPAAEESVAKSEDGLGLSSTHLYLRCNATGFGLTNANRLQPAAGGRLATLTFQVTQPWMVQNGDTCIITETDVLHTWTSQTRSWTVPSPFEAPDTKRLSESWTQFVTRFPAVGTYRAVVDRTIGTVTIAKPGTFQHPFAGALGTQWVPGTFVDHDPALFSRIDYASGDRVLENHAGIDYGVGSFRAMDNGLRITAVAPGVVTKALDGHFDRVTEAGENCFFETNLVEVRHADGTLATYAHLKKNSVAVSVGQSVSAGQTLGVVGSSGCTSGPHLHLELMSSGGTLLDPFKLGLWAQPVPYATPLALMDVALVHGAVTAEQMSDPPPNATTYQREELMGIVAWVSGGMAGDVFTFRLVNPSGGEHVSAPIVYEGIPGQATWILNWFLSAEIGTWKAQFLTNGTLARTETFSVVP
jgi:murein DD-endopeptidase MepM/ murein hydrolase activator NlpD